MRNIDATTASRDERQAIRAKTEVDAVRHARGGRLPLYPDALQKRRSAEVLQRSLVYEPGAVFRLTAVRIYIILGKIIEQAKW